MLPALLACAQPAADAPAEVSDTGPPSSAEPCDVAVRSTPSPGDTDHFYRDPVRLSFTGDPGSLSVSIADSTGAVIETTLTREGNEATLTPAVPLAASTAYTAAIDYCGGALDLSFSTSDFGTPVSAADIVGQTWVFDIMGGEWLAPAASGVVSALTMGDGYVLTVTDADATTVSLRGGRATYTDGVWTQDRCAPTADLTGLDFTANPFAILSGDPLVVGWMTMMQATLSGAFSPDGSALAGMRFAGSVQVTDVSGGFAELKLTAEEACGLLEGFGLSCEDCPDGSGPTCIGYELISVSAEATTPMEQRTEAQVALDPECLGQ